MAISKSKETAKSKAIAKIKKTMASKKVKTRATIPIPLEEARTAIFCGWEGELTFKTKVWGDVQLKGVGLSQVHADLLDFARLHYVDFKCDEVDRVSMIISLAEFCRMKGIQPDAKTFRGHMEDFLQNTIIIKYPNGETHMFVIADYAKYVDEKEGDYKPIPPKKGKKLVDTEETKAHNKAAVPRRSDGLFELRLSSEFQKFISGSRYVDYSELLPGLITLPNDILKQAARFLQTHDEWHSSTNTLHDAISQQQIMPTGLDRQGIAKFKAAARSLRSRRKIVLRTGAPELRELIGVAYDPEKDRWNYVKHALVNISSPLVEPPKSIR